MRVQSARLARLRWWCGATGRRCATLRRSESKAVATLAQTRPGLAELLSSPQLPGGRLALTTTTGLHCRAITDIRCYRGTDNLSHLSPLTTQSTPLTSHNTEHTSHLSKSRVLTLLKSYTSQLLHLMLLKSYTSHLLHLTLLTSYTYTS